MRTPLELVFMANFSDACFRAIPGIAQLADQVDIRLTILHAIEEGGDRKAAEAMLNSFFLEANSYGGTRRITVVGDPVKELKRYAEKMPVDLVVCPGCDPIGLPRPGHRSTRARMAAECRLPMWTFGRRVRQATLAQPVREVGCWMEFGSEDHTHLAFAVEYAAKLGARLHLLHALPEVSEAMLAPYVGEHSMQAVQIRRADYNLMQAAPIQPMIHVHSGNGGRSRAALVKAHNLDVLFSGLTISPLTDWVWSDLGSFDRCSCPVIAIPKQPVTPLWNLDRKRRLSGRIHGAASGRLVAAMGEASAEVG